MRKVVITAALTGAQQGKDANPNIPIAPQEIIDQAVECLSAGAAIIHIHARDKDGRPTADREVFREIVDGIKERGDAVFCLSTGGAATIPLKERISMVPALKPDFASFSVGSGLTGRYDKEKKEWIRDFNLSLASPLICQRPMRSLSSSAAFRLVFPPEFLDEIFTHPVDIAGSEGNHQVTRRNNG